MSTDVKFRFAVSGQAEVASAANQVKEGLQAIQDEARKVQGAGELVVSKFKSLAALVGIGLGVKEFIDTADAMSLLNARLKNTTKTAEEFKAVQNEIYRIAQANSIGFKEAAELYTKLSEPVKRLGGAAKEVGGIVESFALSMRVGGVSAQEAAGATLQFAQAMGSGKLSGDEFRSLAEASPRFMKALSDGMGQPIEKLKALGSEGKLTADVVGNALLKELESLKREAASLPDTVGAATARIKNDFVLMVSALNENSGLSLGLSSIIETIRTDFLPVIKSELGAAFTFVGEAIKSNKDEITGVWLTVKDLIGDVYNFGKLVVTTALSIREWTKEVMGLPGEFSLIQSALETGRLLIAGLIDGTKLIGAAFAGVGSSIMQFLISPFQAYLGMLSTVVGVFDKEQAAAIDGAKKRIDDFTQAGEKYANGVFQEIADGKGAVGKLNAELETTKDRVKNVKELGSAIQRLKDHALSASTGFTTLKNKIQELSKEQQAAEKAANDYIRSLEMQTQIMAKELELGRPLTDAEKARLQLIADLGGKYKDLSKATLLKIENAITDLETQKKLNDAHKDALEFQKSLFEMQQKEAAYQEKLYNDTIEQIVAAEDKALAMEKQLSQIGMTEEAMNALEVQELRNAAAAKKAQIGEYTDPTTVEILNREAAALERQANALESFPKASKWADTFMTIKDGLANALEGGAKAGWKYLLNLFKSQIIKVAVQPIATSLAGGLTDIFQGITGGYGKGGVGQLDMLGSIGKIFDGAQNFQSILSKGATEYITKAGEWLVKNTDGFLNKAGSSILNNAGGLGKIAGGIGGVLSARSVSQSLSGGYSVGGGNMVNNIAGLASLIPGVGQIAGVVGGIVNRAFGRKAKEVTGQGFEGSFSAGDFQGSGFQEWKQKGGWFRSDKKGQDKTELNSELADSLKAGAQELFKSTEAYGKALGLPVDALKDVSANIKVTLGDDQKANEKAIADAFGKYGDALAATFSEKLTPMLKEGETLAQGLERIGGSMSTVNPILKELGLKALEFSVAGATAASKLIELAGGAEEFTKKAQSYYENFYSQGEKTEAGLKQLGEVLAEVGLPLPETRAEFRKLVEGLDLTTESGQKQYTALMDVNSAFASLVPAADDAAGALKKTKDQLEAIKEKLGQTIDSTINKFLTPEQQTERQYTKVQAKLESVGVKVDLDKLVGLSKAEVYDYAQALVNSSEITDEAKISIVEAAGSLADLKDSADQAAAALNAELAQAIDENIGLFLTAEQKKAKAYTDIQADLGKAGVNIDLDKLMGASKDDIFEFAKSFVTAAENSVEAKTAVVNAAGALGKLRDEADATAKDIAGKLDGIIGDFLSGDDLVQYKAKRIQDTLRDGGLGDIPIDNILNATQDQVVEFFNAVGTDGKQAILEAYGPWKDLQEIIHRTSNAIKDYRANSLAEAIDKERLATMKPADRVKALKSKETSLFGQLKTTEDPVGVANKLQSVILERINEEVKIREEATEAQKTALEKQISGAQKLKDLSADIAQFTGSLKFGELSPLDAQAQVGAAQSLYDTTLARAKGGDENAIQNLLSNSQAYLEEAASAFASGPAYVDIFNKVTSELDALGITGAQVDPQIELAQQQLDALTETAGTSTEMLNALLSIDAILAGRVGETPVDPNAVAGASDPGAVAVASTEGTRSGADPTSGAQATTSTGSVEGPQGKAVDPVAVQLIAVAENLKVVSDNTSHLAALLEAQRASLLTDREGFTQVVLGLKAVESAQNQLLTEIRNPVPV